MEAKVYLIYQSYFYIIKLVALIQDYLILTNKNY